MAARIPEERKRELLPRLVYAALSAYSVRRAALEVGIHEVTARDWLDRAGIDLRFRTVRCPSCGGTAERQGLFYWRCTTCGAEWWPPKKHVPENPDLWAAEAGVRAQDAFKVIERLHRAGKTPAEIADELNALGITTSYGKKWTRDNVRAQLTVHGAGQGRRFMETKEQVVALIRSMAEAGHTHEEIAERLNVEGFLPFQGGRWNVNRVKMLMRRNGIRITTKAKRPKTSSLAAREELAWIDQVTGAAWVRRHPR